MGKGRTLLLCAFGVLTACHGDSHPAPVDNLTPHKHAPIVKRGPTPDEMTAGMVEAVTMGRSTVPVAVKFELGNRPTVGQPLDVVLAVMPQILADPAVLTVTGSDALRLAAGFRPIEIPEVDPAQVYRQNVRVTPTLEGVQLLGLSVALNHDEITETRTFAVPIIVAPSADPADGPSGSPHAAPTNGESISSSLQATSGGGPR
ncbi:MAG: hypothetical protein QOD56_277 [Gammaproteobacteria bacterium]|jgi:hypothetical protein|nr:hypothetical protein [Gammaproteobacteria bacterium]